MFQVSCSKFYDDKGFTMVELIVAIAILIFGLIGLYTFFQPATLLSANFSSQIIATYLAQEGLEVVKNIRDNNVLSGVTWSNGLDLCASGCQLDYKTKTAVETPANQLKPYNSAVFLHINSDGFYSYDAGLPTAFKRKVTITQPLPDSNVLKVEVLVSWDYNGKSFNYTTIGYVYNY